MWEAHMSLGFIANWIWIVAAGLCLNFPAQWQLVMVASISLYTQCWMNFYERTKRQQQQKKRIDALSGRKKKNEIKKK